MDETATQTQAPFRAVLHEHRSLSPRGFLILMSAIGGVSFVTGMAFLAIGAWPVLGFFGLDVLLIYVAFKLNYRAARAHEVVELTPDILSVTQVSAKGAARRFEFNPYWARVQLTERHDGRTELRIASHGAEFAFGRLLNDDERRDFAIVLERELLASRSATSSAR